MSESGVADTRTVQSAMWKIPTADRLRGQSTVRYVGRVVRAVGTAIRVSGLPVHIGQQCEVYERSSGARVLANVVGIEQGEAILVPLGGLVGVAVDSEVRVVADGANVPVSEALHGRVLDGFGLPLDKGGDLPRSSRIMPLQADAPNPLERSPINTSLPTGIKVIDTLLTVGVGQRLGVYAPAGVGKSTFLGMLAAHAKVDVVVMGLIGERGREVREFLEDTLTPEIRARSVVVVATSDRSSMERISAANTATAIAEGFRADGKQVLLLIDSVTRYARAVRETGLAVGEPPVRQGFTPSVFADLPKLFERCGATDAGSITAFYTLLLEEDGVFDVISEESRSLLDGHIVLSRQLAESGHFPAVDVLASLSRLYGKLASEPQQAVSQRVRKLLSKHRDVEFLLQVGEYQAGSDKIADEAIAKKDAIDKFLKQSLDEVVDPEQALSQLTAVLQARPLVRKKVAAAK
ncbi:MAG: FliI/YscN family ATPase [Granulosicoccus sp.]